jgi:hypothetical protein
VPAAWIQRRPSIAMPTWPISCGVAEEYVNTRSPARIGSVVQSTAVP